MTRYRIDDLDEILAKSQRLKSSIADASLPSQQFRYRVGELNEASRKLAADSSKGLAGLPSSGPTTDGRRILDDVNNIVLKGQDNHMVGIEGIDLEKYLAHHHDMIVLTAIQSSKQVTEDYMQDMQRKWLIQEWDAARAQFAERIGHRPVEQPHPSAPPLLLDYVTPQKAIKDASVPAIIYVHSEVVKHMSSIEHHQDSVQSYPSFTLHLHDELDKCDSDIFLGNGPDKTLLLSRHDIAGYKACLSLLAHMVGEQRRKHAKFGPFNKPGYFSPICYERNLMNSVTAAQDRHDILAYGSVVYYNQVALDVFTRRASVIGERSPGQTVRSLIKAHVQSLSNGSQSSIYAFVYFCLRAGEYQAAIDEITEFNQSVHNKAMEVDGSVLHLLNAIIILINQYIVTANPAGSHATPSKASNVLDSIGNLGNVIAAIQKLYQVEDSKYQNDQPVDVYKLFVFNLLAVVDKSQYSSGYDISGYVLEDFIWSHVFSIFIKRLYGSYMDSSSSFGATSPMKNKMALVPIGQDAQYRYISEHEELLELIYTFGGAEYFDPGHSNVYKYASLLFSCHRFGDAIHYLYANNKVFAATHLCHLVTYYGLVLPYQDLLCNPSLTIVNTYTAPSVSATPWTVACAYIKNVLYPLKTAGQESNKERVLTIICDYVFLLHTNAFLTYSFMLINEMKDKVKVTWQRSLSEMLQEYVLSLSSEEVAFLVGSIALKEGEQRGKLYIDTYLQQDDKRQLLKSIGYVYLHNYHDVESGIHFLLLSQHYTEAMVELCDVFVQQIVLIQSSANITEHFDYWLQYIHGFKTKFLASDSLILKQLSSSTQGSKLLNVFSCLVSLSLGTRILLAKGQAEDAWTYLKEFLPDASSHATPSLSVVLTHNLLRPVADTVLLTLAKCICSVYTTSKQTQYARNDMYMQSEVKMREMKEAFGSLCKFVDNNKDFLVAAEKTKQEIAQLYQVLM